MSKPENPIVSDKGVDLEAGNGGPAPLYPKMTEDPRLRWAFIRKVYGILALQFLFTSGVTAVVTFIRPIPAFLISNTVGSWTVFIVVLLSPLIAMWPMLRYRRVHPANLVCLALFTFCISLAVGVVCSIAPGRAVLQAVILTATVVVSLTFYAFWAARRGHDFAFLFPFLFSCLLVLIVFLIIRLFFPLGGIGSAVYGILSSIVFSAFIVHDTDQLIKRHTYDEYVVAAISLYMDVINLFMGMLGISAVQ